MGKHDDKKNNEKGEGKREEEFNVKEGFGDSRSSDAKWRYTLYTTILFLLVANPYTFKFVQKVLGKFVTVASREGCPTNYGLLIHALVFTLVLRYLMD